MPGIIDGLQRHPGQDAPPGLPCLWGHENIVGCGLDQERDLPQPIDERFNVKLGHQFKPAGEDTEIGSLAEFECQLLQFGQNPSATK